MKSLFWIYFAIERCFRCAFSKQVTSSVLMLQRKLNVLRFMSWIGFLCHVSPAYGRQKHALWLPDRSLAVYSHLCFKCQWNVKSNFCLLQLYTLWIIFKLHLIIEILTTKAKFDLLTHWTKKEMFMADTENQFGDMISLQTQRSLFKVQETLASLTFTTMLGFKLVCSLITQCDLVFPYKHLQ